MNIILIIVILIFLVIVLNKWMEESARKQRIREEELEEKAKRQKHQKNLDDLENFVLKHYGSDGGYHSFSVGSYNSSTRGYDKLPLFNTDGSAACAGCEWEDRDGARWVMHDFNWFTEALSNGLYSDCDLPLPPYTRDVNRLSFDMEELKYLEQVGWPGVMVEKVVLYQAWAFFVKYTFDQPEIKNYFSSHPNNNQMYKTPYQAKLAAQQYTINAIKNLGY